MNIVFLTEGGRKQGWGHISRCHALAQAMRATQVRHSIRIFVNTDEPVKNFLEDTWAEVSIMDWIKNKKALLHILSDAQLVVVDSYQAGKRVYEDIDSLKSLNPGIKTLIIDDYNRLKYKGDYILNPCVFADDLNYRKIYASARVKLLLGRKYIILRKDFWNFCPGKVKAEVKNVLVAFGGNGHPDLVIGIVRKFLARYSDWHFHIVLKEGGRRVKKELRSSGRLSLRRSLNAKEMLKLMRHCDIAITSGGQILYELAQTATPAVAVCFSFNQLANCRKMKELKVIQYAGQDESGSLVRKVEETVALLQPKTIRQKMAAAGQRLIDGKGVFRILKALNFN